MRVVLFMVLWLLGDAGAAPPEPTIGFATSAQVFSPRGDPAWIGLELHLQHVTVVDKSGLGLWISNGKRRVFVVPIDPSELEALAVGAHIDVRGELRRAPAADEARLLYGVRSRDARRIAASAHIIDAWSITRPM